MTDLAPTAAVAGVPGCLDARRTVVISTRESRSSKRALRFFLVEPFSPSRPRPTRIDSAVHASSRAPEFPPHGSCAMFP